MTEMYGVRVAGCGLRVTSCGVAAIVLVLETAEKQRDRTNPLPLSQAYFNGLLIRYRYQKKQGRLTLLWFETLLQTL